MSQPSPHQQDLVPEVRRNVDALVAHAQVEGRAPSLVIGLVRGGNLVHRAGAGECPPSVEDMQYRIGSITKTMTALLLLQLRDEGRLALDDPLERFLPGTPAGRVTLRQLLSHTAGLQREPEGGGWWERIPGMGAERLLAGLTPEQLVFPPFRKYHYSNLAYGLLGAVLERVAGRPWFALLNERLLEPLGMRRTTYHPEDPYAHGYVVHPLSGTLHEEPRTDTGAMAPAGQLWSTVTDLAQWAACLAEPPAAVISPGTLDEMCVPVALSDLEGWSGGHGLGIELYRQGDRILAGHGGSMPGYVSMLLVHRRTRVGVVAFANAYGFPLAKLCFDILAEVIARESESATAPWLPAEPPPRGIAELCGRWWWMGLAHDAVWRAEAGSLEITRAGREPWRFVPEGADRWRGRSGMNDGELLRVLRNPAQHVEALDIATFRFSRDPDRLA